MIPIKLTMHNFMCYREAPPLHFDGIHTACICGNNGNGKSALIDAITWALWGQSRAKSDDDLIHSGENETRVELDFAVGQQIYRVIRRHARPKRRQASGQSSLDLLIRLQADSFKVISGDKIKETEQKIRGILHMDYDTFVNSAFLRQGHADEFTKQPPTKRKEVLANILGLAVYDQLEEQAKESARKQESTRTQLENTIREIDNELLQKPACQTRLEQLQGELATLEKTIAGHQSTLDHLRMDRETLAKKELQLSQLIEHVSRTQKELARWQEQLDQHRTRLKEYEGLIAQRSDIEQGYAQLSEVKKQNVDLDQRFRQSVTLNERQHELEKAIERAQTSLLTEHKLAQSRIADLEAKSEKIPQLKVALQQVQAQLQKLAGDEEALRQKRQTCQELQTKVNYLETTRAQLERDVAEIEDKLKLLMSQGDARCPLCERELGTEHRALIEQKYTGDRDGKSAAAKSHQAEMVIKKAELKSLENEISRTETKLNQEKAKVQGSASVLHQQISEAEQAGTRLLEERKGLAEIEERLNTRSYALNEQQTLSLIEEELTKLHYDAPEHEQVRQRLAELEPLEPAKRQLEEADRLIHQEKEFIARAEQAGQELRLSLAADEQQRQALSTEVSRLPQVVASFAQAEAEHQTLVTQQRQVEEAVWGVRSQLRHCEELEAKKKEKEQLRLQAVQEEQIYKELAQAFGKEGIQAMLIEIAIPEIEIEANKLLGRMTDNRMHVKMETQRETKKGTVAETLDIYIADELGTRNYEMFSGGETFRINFAIRIALSKLLARRTGAPLRTLIIDEGFGTQDSTGIEKLKEAINSIQDDFDKILVITHIDELKDAFPARIDVIKTADGSTIEVS